MTHDAWESPLNACLLSSAVCQKICQLHYVMSYCERVADKDVVEIDTWLLAAAW